MPSALLWATQLPERPALQVVPIGDPCFEQTLTPLLLDTAVNGYATHQDVDYFRRSCGAILASKRQLEDLRIITNGRPTVFVDHSAYVLLNAFPDLQFKVDEDAAVMVIEGEPQIFYPSVINLDAPQPPPVLPAENGALLNYGVYQYGTLQRGNPQNLQSYELNLFGGWGTVGSQVLLLSSLASNRPLRTFTTYTLDDEAHLNTLRLGDVYTRSSAWGATRPIGGVQWGRNFSLNPSLITTPVTELDLNVRRHAALSLNASDLFSIPQDNAALYFGNLGLVPYGPVQVVNIPSGYANRQLRLRAQQNGQPPVAVISPDYYALGLLRQGFSDYSIELGKTRASFISDDYRQLLTSATYRYGATQWLTLESHLEATQNAAAAGSTVDLAVPYLGVLEATGAGSHSENLSGLSGQWSLAVTNAYQRFGYRASYRRYTPQFVLPGFDASVGRKDEVQGTLSFSTFGIGNMFIGYSRVRTQTSAVANFHSASGFLFAGYSANFYNGLAISAFGSHSLTRGQSDSLSVNLSLPFTLFDRVGNGAYTTQAQIAVSQDLNQKARADLRLSNAGRVGESEYNVQVARSVLGSDFTSVYGVLNHPNFLATSQLTNIGADTIYNIGATGSVALMDSKFYFSEPVGGSFAVLKLGKNYADVHANGQKADQDGDVFLPNLAAYVENSVRLETQDLPLSFQPDTLAFYVRPRYRSGVIVTPHLLPERDVLIQIMIQDGVRQLPAPLGTYATVAGREDDFPAGDDGMIYFYGIEDDTKVVVHYRGNECPLQLKLPPYVRQPASEVVDIPHLGPYTCEGVLP